MKKLIIIFLLFVGFQQLKAQTTSPGPVEKRLTDSICGCISKLDLDKIKSGDESKKAFMNCFSNYASMLPDVAEEHGVEMTDGPAMRSIGEGIGKNLVKENCSQFMALSMKMAGADSDEPETMTVEGKIKRIETKDFNYLIVEDDKGIERSLLWLEPFKGSEILMKPISDIVGKSVSVVYREIEAYIPSAKDYYKLKEISSLSLN